MLYLGNVIEGQLLEYDDVPQGLGKQTKRERRYKNVQEVFDVIEGRKKVKTRTQRSVDALKRFGLVIKDG